MRLNKLRLYLITIFAFFVFAVPTYSQVKDDPILKACEETADKLKQANIELESLKTQLALEKERTVNAQQQAQNYKEQADFWKKANETGKQIDSNNLIAVETLRVQVEQFRQENSSLRVENEKLRGSRNLRTVIGLGVGFGLGKAF